MRIVAERTQCLRLKAYARIEEKTVIAVIIGGEFAPKGERDLHAQTKYGRMLIAWEK